MSEWGTSSGHGILPDGWEPKGYDTPEPPQSQGLEPTSGVEMPFRFAYSPPRRDARVAESGGLENRYTRKGIEGSNPSLSAILRTSAPGSARNDEASRRGVRVAEGARLETV